MSSVLRDVLGQVLVMLRNVAPHPAHVGKRRFHTRDNMRRGYEVQQLLAASRTRQHLSSRGMARASHRGPQEHRASAGVSFSPP